MWSLKNLDTKGCGGWGIFIAPNHFDSHWPRLLAMGAPGSPVCHRTGTVPCPVRRHVSQSLGFGVGRPLEALSSCGTGQSGALWLRCSDFRRNTVAHCITLQNRPLALDSRCPLAQWTVRWIIAEHAQEFLRVASWHLYGPDAPDIVRWHTRQSGAPNFSTLNSFCSN
jgi:hypothetical protein